MSTTRAPSLHRRYPASSVLRAPPTSTTARSQPFQTARLTAATRHRRGSLTLPQRPCAHAVPTTPAGEDGFSDRLLPRPPAAFPLWQEGRLQRETIQACSGFTRVTACALAPWLHQGLPQRLQPGDHSPRPLQWLPGCTDNSPGGTRTRWPSRPRRFFMTQLSSLGTLLS
jgi:hypothetical protein